MPPWGHPLLILIVLVASLWLMVIYRLVTILMIHWDVAGSSLVFLMSLCKAAASLIDEMRSKVLDTQNQLIHRQRDEFARVKDTVQTEMKS